MEETGNNLLSCSSQLRVSSLHVLLALAPRINLLWIYVRRDTLSFPYSFYIWIGNYLPKTCLGLDKSAVVSTWISGLTQNVPKWTEILPWDTNSIAWGIWDVFWLDIRETFFLGGMVRRWRSLPKEVVESPSLGVFQNYRDMEIVFIISFSALTKLVVLLPILVAFLPSTLGTVFTQNTLFLQAILQTTLLETGYSSNNLTPWNILNNFLISPFHSSNSERLGEQIFLFKYYVNCVDLPIKNDLVLTSEQFSNSVKWKLDIWFLEWRINAILLELNSFLTN